MEYAADLPINTMGRRIRTRLYFTSESHLHTLLNVFRFPSKDQNDRTLLSKRGCEIISSAPELCYLTQVLIRLFENTKKEINDPRRFRIEISFSPGATATPEHMAELDRDFDSSRFDTEPLRIISKDNLTCEELEQYVSQSIREGKTDEDDEPTHTVLRSSFVKQVSTEIIQEPITLNVPKPVPKISTTTAPAMNQPLKSNVEHENGTMNPSSSSNIMKNTTSKPENDFKAKKNESKILKTTSKPDESEKLRSLVIPPEDSINVDDVEEDEEAKIERMARNLAQKYIWSSIAAASFILGVGCLVLSRKFKDGHSSRRWSKRYP
jgi:hypothetical protein